MRWAVLIIGLGGAVAALAKGHHEPQVNDASLGAAVAEAVNGAMAEAHPGDTLMSWVADAVAVGSSDVTFWLSVRSGPNFMVRVRPGEIVRYEVFGELSDEGHQGLALFGLDLVFDGGDLEQANSPQGEPTPGCDNPMINFTIPWGITNPDGFGGTVIDGNLIQVGGGQNTINNTPDNAHFPIGPVLTGVCQPSGCGPTVIVTGSLRAPEHEGVYTLRAENIFANVIKEGETGEPFWATESALTQVTRDLVIRVRDDRKKRPAIGRVP
jgi:hypothetical protein